MSFPRSGYFEATQPVARDQPGAATASPVEGTIRSVFVISEVALTCVLLVGAGLLARLVF